VATIAFGPFQLDPHTLELRKQGRKVALRPQPCRVLALLASRPGQLVTRREIRQAVWPAGLYVRFDLGLNSCLKQIRHALGETARSPGYLETLTGRGYRFVGEAAVLSERPARPRLRLTLLPFTGAGAATQGFADGLADEVTVHLLGGTLGDVAVVDNSVLVGAITVREAVMASRRADVDLLLQCRVRIDQDVLRLTARLLSTHNLTHVWAESFDEFEGHTSAGHLRIAAVLARAVTVACAGLPSPVEERASLANPIHDDMQGRERTRLLNRHQRDEVRPGGSREENRPISPH
jgi:DNA-binding winged helix-turn-helix (wHTH) protein